MPLITSVHQSNPSSSIHEIRPEIHNIPALRESNASFTSSQLAECLPYSSHSNSG